MQKLFSDYNNQALKFYLKRQNSGLKDANENTHTEAFPQFLRHKQG